MNIVEINNLTVGYDECPILNNINLNIKKGEFISVIGPNGAGKSTLLKSLCNILDSNHCVKLLGKEKESYSSKELAKIISYVPQLQNTKFNFTCKEFILMSRYSYLKPFESLSRADYLACEKAMEITDTKKYKDRIMENLSGGERQKVLIASSIAQESEILLLDEPTTFLDPKHISQVMDIIKKANENTTVIMVTHDLNTIGCSDRIIGLKEGNIVFDATPKEFYKNKVASDIFDTAFIYLENNENTYIFSK